MNAAQFKGFTRMLNIGALSLGLVACGGGGGSSAPAAPAVPDVTVSGILTYTDFNVSKAGIDYANPVDKPIRGAVIELQNPPGTVVASANTSVTGAYSFSAPANASVLVVVKAALGSPASPDTKVVNNTDGNSLYASQFTITTATSDVSQSFNANSGWDGASYTAKRSAAPFAILDTIHQAQLMVRAADSNVVFPPLTVKWSATNIEFVPKAGQTEADGNEAVGEVPGTAYGAPDLFLLGKPNIDTDEYDSVVIGHEWGHYFQEKFSRSDSIGGEHTTGGDVLHPSVAFDEGFGNAMGSMITGEVEMINTMGSNQSDGSILVASMEADATLDTHTQADVYHIYTDAGQPIPTTADAKDVLLDGFYSENSLMEIVYDLFDSGAADTDNDGVSLGFAPLYRVMTNQQKNTRAFTSIFSFLHYLKLEVPASASAIDALAMAENINLTGANEFDNPAASAPVFGGPLYTTINPDGVDVTLDAQGDLLQTYEAFGKMTEANTGGNKLFNHMFFKGTVVNAGCYTLTATPHAATPNADLMMIFPEGGFVNTTEGGVAEAGTDTFEAGEKILFGVGSVSGVVAFSVKFSPSNASDCEE